MQLNTKDTIHLPFMRLLLPAAIALVTTALVTTTASAEILEEVLVTAQKRVESLQDVPISVQALTGQDIQDAGIQNLGDLSASVPNVSISEGFAGETISIRGFGSGGNPSFEQAVATFIDGVYFGRAKQSLASFLDVERVEVLRGPQSTFFGNNAIAGALNIATKKPTEKMEGSIVASYAPDDEDFDVTFAYGGMLTDTFGARVALKYRTLDGYLRRQQDGVGAGGTPEKDVSIGRLSLLWQPSNELEVFFKAEIGNEDTVGSTAQLEDCPAPIGLQGVPSATPEQKLLLGSGLCDVAIKLTGNSGFNFDKTIETGGLNPTLPGASVVVPPQNINSILAQEGGEFRDLDTENYNLTLNYDLSGYTLTAITGYTGYESDRQFDVDQLSVASISTNRQEEFSQWSQEFRVVSPGGKTIDWLAGAYLQSNEVAFGYQTYTLLNAPDGLPSPVPGGLGVQGGTLGKFQGAFDEDSDTWAIFAAATFNATDDFSLTVGLRYTEVEKEGSNVLNLALTTDNNVEPIEEPGAQVSIFGSPGSPVFVAHTFDNVPVEEEHVTGSITANWHATDKTMLYLSYSEGFKSGGYDNLIRLPEVYPAGVGLCAANDPRPPCRGTNPEGLVGTPTGGSFTFDTEEVEAFELGAKMDWGSVRLNLALFRSEFTNLQQSIFNPTTIAFQIENAGNAISQGLEADLTWGATNNLIISASASILDASYDEFEGASCSRQETVTGLQSCSLTGEDLPFSPKWNAIVNFDHVLPLSSNLLINTQLSLAYTDEYKTGAESDPRFIQDAFETINLRVALGNAGGTWNVALWGRNLTDKLTVGQSTNAAVRSLGPILQTTNRPMSWGISAGYNF